MRRWAPIIFIKKLNHLHLVRLRDSIEYDDIVKCRVVFMHIYHAGMVTCIENFIVSYPEKTKCGYSNNCVVTGGTISCQL